MDIDIAHIEIMHRVFVFEWKSSHHEDGDFLVPIPTVVFGQPYWDKNIPRTVAQSLEMAPLSPL